MSVLANGTGSTLPATYHVVLAVRSDAFAGVERYMSVTANRLIALGHSVTLIGGETARMQAESPRATVIPAARTRDVVRALVTYARCADVVHAHMTAADTAVAISRPLLRGTAISTLHFASPRGSSLTSKILRWLVNRTFDCQVAISEYVRHASRSEAIVILNGVPLAGEARGVDARRVLIVQRLEPEKNTSEALRAWVASGLAADGWELVIVGGGSDRPALEALVARKRIPAVTFLGHRHDVAALRLDASMQLTTAPAEPFGLSVVEAMAMGLPVVATDAGGHRETVGACCPELLYPAGDHQACGSLLRHLAFDRARRVALGHDLRAHQQAHLSDSAHAATLVDLYDRLLQSRRAS